MPLNDTTKISTAITEGSPRSDHASAPVSPDATAVTQHRPPGAAANVQPPENPPLVNKARRTTTGKGIKRAREEEVITRFFGPLRKSTTSSITLPEGRSASRPVPTPDAAQPPTGSAPADPLPGGNDPTPASGPQTPGVSPAAAHLGPLPAPLAHSEGPTASGSVLTPDATPLPTGSAPGEPIQGGSDPAPASGPQAPEVSPAAAQLGLLPSLLPGPVDTDMPTDVPGMLRAIFLQNNVILAEGRRRQTANAEHFQEARNAAEKHTRMIMEDQEARHGETVQHFNTLNQTLTVGATPSEPDEDKIEGALGVLPSQVIGAMNAARREGWLLRGKRTMVTGDFAPYFQHYMEKVHNFDWRTRRGPKQALDCILQMVYERGESCLRHPPLQDHPIWRFRPKANFRNNAIPGWQVREGFKAR